MIRDGFYRLRRLKINLNEIGYNVIFSTIPYQKPNSFDFIQSVKCQDWINFKYYYGLN